MALSLTRTPEELDAILRASAGSLVDTPYPVLLLAVAYRERNAVLTLQRNQLHKEIVFHAGSPVDCQSNIATETFARFLEGTGKLSEMDYQSALALSATRGMPLEDVLIEKKLLSATDLDRMLQQSLGRKLLEPFAWKSGTFEISDEETPADSALRVKVPQLVLTGIMKVEVQDAVDEEIEPASDQYLALANAPLFDLSEIRMSSEQQKVLDAARGGARLRDVAAETGIDAEDVRRIVYALLLLGALKITPSPKRAEPLFELENPFAKTTTESPMPVAPPPPVAKPEPPRVTVIPPATGEELAHAVQSLRTNDAFELLEVAPEDGPVQFTRAYIRIAERFLPSKFDPPSRDKAQDVFLAAARAYAELADPVRREALVAARTRKTQPAPQPEKSLDDTLTVPAPVAPEKKTTERKPMKAAIIDPELLCKSGRELAEQGKLREALSSFEMAAECDAQNGTYAAEVAWCRFRLHVSPAPTTLKMLKNAIRIDPRSGLANLYAGKVATALGNKTEASAFLNRAAMLMPRDLRVVEALKALK